MGLGGSHCECSSELGSFSFKRAVVPRLNSSRDLACSNMNLADILEQRGNLINCGLDTKPSKFLAGFEGLQGLQLIEIQETLEGVFTVSMILTNLMTVQRGRYRRTIGNCLTFDTT
jgi:hypothetical protein